MKGNCGDVMAKYEIQLTGSFDEWLSGIESGIVGGSQAVFFKINTWGEETFLEKFEELVE